MEKTTMRFTPSALLVLAFTAVTASAQSPAKPNAAPALKWGPAPAVFPAGAQMAVLEGNPGGTGLFTVRLRFPNGYKIAPHIHPTDENVTVISGTFKVGMGSTFDTKNLVTLPAGGFVTAKATMAHFAVAKGETVVQVHALGPFALTYINPADTPRAGGTK
jgi:quercetin dioxygenase-like cupin family protein